MNKNKLKSFPYKWLHEIGYWYPVKPHSGNYYQRGYYSRLSKLGLPPF